MSAYTYVCTTDEQSHDPTTCPACAPSPCCTPVVTERAHCGCNVALVVLVCAATAFFEMRHARECPRDPRFGVAADVWARLWLLAWTLVMVVHCALCAHAETDWDFKHDDRVVTSLIVLVMTLLLETGLLPGCPRLVVSCAATMTMLILVRAFMCDEAVSTTVTEAVPLSPNLTGKA